MPDKPRLPWYRPRNFVLGFLLICITLIGLVVIRALSARPGSAIDYAAKMNELARTSQPAGATGQNRWDEYLTLLEDFKAIQDACDASASEAIGETLYLAYAYDTSEADAAAAPIVRADAIACLDAIRATDIYNRLDAFIDPAIVYYEIPNESYLVLTAWNGFAESRALTRALTAEFRVALDEGRNDDAARAASHALAMARISMHQPVLIGYLVGLAQTHIIAEQIRIVALDESLDAPIALALLQLLNPEHLIGVDLALRGEQLSMSDLVQRLHTDDGEGNGMYLPAEFNKLDLGFGTTTGIQTNSLVNATGFLFPDKQTTLAKAEAFYQECRSQTKMTANERRLAKNLDQYAQEELGRTDVLLKMMLPAIGNIINVNDHSKLVLDTTRILLALSIYHAEHGEYPDALDQLAPGILAEIPSDGFAPDAKYRYFKRTPTGDDPRAFILYSVGGDFTDDGGAFDDNREALTNRAQGTDYVVNPPTAISEQD